MLLEMFAGSLEHDRFPLVRRGYDPAIVDAYLDSLDGWDRYNPAPGAPSATEVMDQMFPVVKRGYDRARVHRYMFALAGGEAARAEMKALAA